VKRLRFLAEVACIALLGGAQTAAFIHTAFWPLQLLAVALLAWRVSVASPRRAAFLGWAFGTAWLCAGTWWMYVSMHRYGGLPAGLAALAVFALCAFLSLYLAAAMAAVAHWRRPAALPSAAMFAGAWLLAELARGVIFTGFPWVASGYAHVDSPFGGFAPWVGVYGLGAIAAGVAAAFGFSRPGAARAWLAPGCCWQRRWRSAPSPAASTTPGRRARSRCRCCRATFPQEEKFAMRYVRQALAATVEQLVSARGDLVIGPETVIPLLPASLDPAVWEELLERFRQPGHAALIGLPLGNEEQGYTNSAAGISASTAGLPAASIATTSTTWCRSASSSRPAFAGSPS
jgi:apolipoprotein N-acyltransferase